MSKRWLILVCTCIRNLTHQTNYVLIGLVKIFHLPPSYQSLYFLHKPLGTWSSDRVKSPVKEQMNVSLPSNIPVNVPCLVLSIQLPRTTYLYNIAWVTSNLDKSIKYINVYQEIAELTCCWSSKSFAVVWSCYILHATDIYVHVLPHVGCVGTAVKRALQVYQIMKSYNILAQPWVQSFTNIHQY